MNYSKEIFKFDSKMPVKIIIHHNKHGFIPKHWHNCLEMTYILSGNIEVWNNGTSREYKKGDIALTNSGEIHSINPIDKETTTAITIIIPDVFFVENYSNYENVTFYIEGKKEYLKFERIFKSIYSLYEEIDYEDSNNEIMIIKIRSYIFEILYLLLSEYKKEKKTQVFYNTQKYLDRMKCITKHIEDNYKNDITLEILAKEFCLSKEHISRNFKEYVGITFTKYLETIRVYNAHRDLLNTDYSITDIALNNGFPNVKSFINSFKKAYGETPSKYRASETK